MHYFDTFLQKPGWDYDFATHQFVPFTRDTSEQDKDLIEKKQSLVCGHERNKAILDVTRSTAVGAEHGLIVAFLRMKSKYPKDHPRYQAQDEFSVLTTRLRKVLIKMEDGTFLSDEDKRYKHAKIR